MYTVTVTQQNMRWFENMLPAEFAPRQGLESQFVLGAVTENEKGPCAAGVLVFDFSDITIGREETLAAEIRWLYTSVEFRRQGVAECLLNEFFNLCAGAAVSVALCDVPTDSLYLELTAYLESWGFEFALDTRYEVRTTLDRLKAIAPLWEAAAHNITPWGSLSPQQQAAAAKALDARPDTPVDLEERINLCDGDISCVCIKDGRLAGGGIARALSGDIVEICYLRSFDKSNRLTADIMRFMAAAAAKKYSGSTQIRYDCYRNHAIEFTGRYLPEIQPPLVYRGACLIIEEQEE